MFVKKLNDFGDTIVEVMIAISIIGVVLVGGYVTTNYELTTNRQSQERSVVVQLEKAQVEELQSMSNDGSIINLNDPSNPAFIPYNTQFCIKDTASAPITNPSNCNFSSDGSQSNSSASPYFYNIVISAVDNNVVNGDWNHISVTATWEKAGGNGQDNAQLVYKFYINNLTIDVPQS